MNQPQLTHEKLDIYQCSSQFLALCTKVLEKTPTGNSELKDQLKRASLSIVLNIAEACGKTTTRDNARFFAIARGSALECGAVLDVCKILGISDYQILAEGKHLVIRIVSMLSKLCR